MGKKRNFVLVTAIVALGTLLSLSANSKNGGGWGKSNKKFNDKWNWIFVSDPPANTTSTTVNTGSPVSGASEDSASYGEGTMNCRDSVAKISTENGVSSLTISEIAHDKTQTLNCTSFVPLPKVDGIEVNQGTVTMKCTNGALRVTASNCKGIPVAKEDPPKDPSGGGGGTTTPPPENQCPVGYSVKNACGCCSDTRTAYYTKTMTVKQTERCNRTSAKYYRKCSNGNYFLESSGTCYGKNPSEC